MKSRAYMVYYGGVFLTAAVLLTSTISAESGESAAINPGAIVDGLRLEARVRLIDNQGQKQLVIHAYLVNEGSNHITVLTKELGPSISRDANGLVVGFDFTGRLKRNGRLVVPSLIPKEPVTLRPGEVAMLTARKSSKSFVDPLKDGEKIRVGYLVSEEWGRRFDIWHGYVCAVIPVEELPSE